MRLCIANLLLIRTYARKFRFLSLNIKLSNQLHVKIVSRLIGAVIRTDYYMGVEKHISNPGQVTGPLLSPHAGI